MSTLSASSLPENILTVIMSYIDSLSELKECRLVCKAWSNPGLTNMLGQKIVLQSDSGMLRLYDILSREPSRAHLIKHLRIEAEVSDSIFLRQLLRLALTPSIEKIQGDFLDDDFFNEFNIIMETWLQGFKRLGLLPRPQMISTAYISAISNIKDSLEDLQIDIRGDERDAALHYLIPKLPQFKKLTRLVLIVDQSMDIRTLEMVLSHCSHVTCLTYYFDAAINDLLPLYTKKWNESSVKKEQHLKILCIDPTCPTDYLQYFLHKYPNIDYIIIDTVICDEQTMVDLGRIIGLIEKDPRKGFVRTASPRQDFHAIMKYLLQEHKYKINLYYNKIIDQMELDVYPDE